MNEKEVMDMNPDVDQDPVLLEEVTTKEGALWRLSRRGETGRGENAEKETGDTN